MAQKEKDMQFVATLVLLLMGGREIASLNTVCIPKSSVNPKPSSNPSAWQLVPRTIAENSGLDATEAVAQLKAAHAQVQDHHF